MRVIQAGAEEPMATRAVQVHQKPDRLLGCEARAILLAVWMPWVHAFVAERTN